MPKKESKPIKLNLGCGIELQPGFINVDMIPLKWLKEKSGLYSKAKVAGKYVRGDVRKLPFKDNYADYIIASEILEHIPLADVNKTLREWVRVLKPGGKMIITCPDFNAIANDWVREMINAPFDPAVYGDTAQVIYGSQIGAGEFHKCPITPQFFQYYLGSMGLKEGKIKVYPKGTPTIDYDGKPAKPNYVYRNGVVHVEVIK